MQMRQFQHISKDNLILLNDFLARLGEGVRSFRYFEKRPLEVVVDHLLAVVLVDETSGPLAYGHLEREDGVLWLGIAVAEEQKGKGIGKLMMHYLINFAREHNEKTINLTVDKSNAVAAHLYESFGFVISDEKHNYYKYVYQIP
ncbi:GNAT family N-acetyltransferase [Fibrella sp. HMF5335]|uniref:GNAT family N-acetyltransferase n=1 Tax=Fibrella rubiginis TaxID=2817060 RepID=A0A939K649_9BACT|nr:GNAT family N-acetyltransferase [Fibrella rubiginis]MBO0937946.1 GNAT family N-acetyltransferase [Fibrella rubiginis]